MANQIETIGWEITLFKGDESKAVVFVTQMDPNVYPDAKDAAIAYLGDNWATIKLDHVGFLPKFSTFRVVGLGSTDRK